MAIHERAEHLLAKNPDMKKSTAFAVATQQMEALGKTPRGFGTPEGHATSKAKYKTPSDDVKTPNPGGLSSPKMEKKSEVEMILHAFFDELDKIAAAIPPPLPAAARGIGGAVKSLAKPKLYGEEGFQALMQGAKSAPNPFASMKLGSLKDTAKHVGKAVLEHGVAAGSGFLENRVKPVNQAMHGALLGDSKLLAEGAGGIGSGAMLYRAGRKSGQQESEQQHHHVK